MPATSDPGSAPAPQLAYLPRALAIVWRSSRGWTSLWITALLTQGLLPVALVFLTRILVDRLLALLDSPSGGAGLETLVGPGLLAASVLLLTEGAAVVDRFARTAQADRVRDHISELIHARTTAVDLAHFESPEYHDRLYRARNDSYGRPVDLVHNLGTLLQHTVTLVAMAAVLLRFGWWVPPVLVLSAMPALAVVAVHARRYRRWEIQSTPSARRAWYLDWLLTTREPAAEVRLYGLGPEFGRAYQSLRRSWREARLRLDGSESVSQIAVAVFAVAISAAVAVWMTIRTVRGELTGGELAMFAQAYYQGQRLTRSMLQSAGQVWASSLFLDNLFAFLAVEPAVRDPDRPLPPPAETPPSIRLSAVAFRYPGAQHAVFTDLDLEVPSGTTAALLGVNGAGKTTLAKLLCRFYDPDSGKVEIGGVDLRRLRLGDSRGLVSALFQEPVRYSESVRRNITVGRPAPDEAGLCRAVELAEASALVARLSNGLDTELGTWFSGGVEISVGEWHRLALARALARTAPVLILDEPTAAMDSWAEARWRAHLGELGRNRTVVLITHRLTTAMHADSIHVMEAGRIVESGTHAELIAAGGSYQAAWDGQFRGAS